MTPQFFDPESFDLECEVVGTDVELSIRRLWEYAFLGQVNVTECPISAQNHYRHVAKYVDIFNNASGISSYICRLEDLDDVIANMQADVGVTTNNNTQKTLHDLKTLKAVVESNQQESITAFLRSVETFIYGLSKRTAVRGDPAGFCPSQLNQTGIFFLPGLHSRLEKCLQQVGSNRQTASNWREFFKNFSSRGLKEEEIDRSGLWKWLLLQETKFPARRWVMQDLLAAISWKHLRISVIPVVELSQKSLALEAVNVMENSGLKTKDKKRMQVGERRVVTAYDRSLGYRIERIEHDTLWGPETHWQAVTHDGTPIINRRGSPLLSSQDVASRLASHHAQRWLPKRAAAELWKDYAWPGGKNYQEWIVTLPWYQDSTIDNHFGIRNILAHVRCDERQDDSGRRILLLHEIQSDWVQQWLSYQRENANTAEPTYVMSGIPEPPLRKEWISLVLKLMLLHAVWWRFEGLAWTTGAQQFERFCDAEQWLTTLYDHRLPREINKILAPHAAKTATLSLRSELNEGSLELKKVHGVLLDEHCKASITRDGFYVWG